MGTRADHPHARGENMILLAISFGINGPSPRAWGELGTGRNPADDSRTIPTRVGRTLGLELGLELGTDHPHARGENDRRELGNQSVHGPSPRAWGEPTGVEMRPVSRRTIPTRVGRTFAANNSRQCLSDHPHARGENSRGPAENPRTRGPSPRAWGELSRPGGESPHTRTIPTRVGRTSAILAMKWLSSDHPHARGENKRNRAWVV